MQSTRAKTQHLRTEIQRTRARIRSSRAKVQITRAKTQTTRAKIQTNYQSQHPVHKSEDQTLHDPPEHRDRDSRVNAKLQQGATTSTYQVSKVALAMQSNPPGPRTDPVTVRLRLRPGKAVEAAKGHLTSPPGPSKVTLPHPQALEKTPEQHTSKQAPDRVTVLAPQDWPPRPWNSHPSSPQAQGKVTLSALQEGHVQGIAQGKG